MVEEKGKGEGFRHLVRVANTDLDGKKQIGIALKKVKGVGFSLASALCRSAGLDAHRQAGGLTEEESSRLDSLLKELPSSNIPDWMFNRKRDPETGNDTHLLSADLSFTKDNDIKKLRRIKCLRGMRHASGLPLRGQRTKSNFRKKKSAGKKGGLGVIRKKGR